MYTLMRIYKTMRDHKDKNKVWLKIDFRLSKFSEESHFHTLEVLGLIEKVDVVYNYGKAMKTCRNVKAWRLKFER